MEGSQLLHRIALPLLAPPPHLRSHLVVEVVDVLVVVVVVLVLVGMKVVLVIWFTPTSSGASLLTRGFFSGA